MSNFFNVLLPLKIYKEERVKPDLRNLFDCFFDKLMLSTKEQPFPSHKLDLEHFENCEVHCCFDAFLNSNLQKGLGIKKRHSEEF